MSDSAAETKANILESAKKEFLEKGFVNASLRTIASNAGVTTGAMYRHFKDKDALFCALVDNAIDVSRKAVMTADVIAHKGVADPVGAEHHNEEIRVISELLDYIYSDFDAFTLLITKSSGSTHENFLDEICEQYTENCIRTFRYLHKQGYAKTKPDDMTIHVIASGLINAFAEIIVHKIPKKNAVKFITNIRNFFHYGTLHLMQIPCD
ncbi:MAG: TetR/AcrR family transcriptional regulator [Treponema sp.]|jgi:AcrR family transcriptional regulator|nr:TetR/AcrR family transcriptional regulator [Treponema sp.]MBR6296311.1 TetR/AcrR family transcriptional regulator [Treponema sp.]